MLLHSTEYSIRYSEATVFAILESLTSIALSVVIVWHTGSILHIFVSVFFAPLLLLKTKLSARLALRTLSRCNPRIGELFYGFFYVGFFFGMVYGFIIVDRPSMGSVAGEAVAYVALKIASLFAFGFLGAIVAPAMVLGFSLIGIRIFCASVAFLRSPLRSVWAIPQNWYHVVFCVDSYHPPEVVPGVERQATFVQALATFSFSNAAGHFVTRNRRFKGNIPFFDALLLIVMFFPALLYRFSLKSSSIVYIPLLWVFRSGKTLSRISRERIDFALEMECKSVLSKIQFAYAWIVVVGFTLVPIYFYARYSASFSEAVKVAGDVNVYLANLMQFFIVVDPYYIESWHLSRFVAAALTIVLVIYSDVVFIKRKYAHDCCSVSSIFVVDTIKSIRLPLTLFTTASALYILYTSVPWSDISFRVSGIGDLMWGGF